ncbi:hypothetical protein [Microvirga lotononidis]|uniref:Uncharacterized protein n=1 Tax=Microvirga lotononidis TaxID=864069 RepID=I4Z208_9HYPH|nr:hypothetical protein [Microvirga lotononidis]EIM30250.1 hypothetical protein MicloDRAFT_00010550 [Microvirga lotononidis]WQO31535.1 hypothetical protein U0023_29600 [Microvirga lotononidis]
MDASKIPSIGAGAVHPMFLRLERGPKGCRDGDGKSAGAASATAEESPRDLCGHSSRWVRDFPN